MILSIILLVLIVILVALLILFLFFRLLPSIKAQNPDIQEDAVMSDSEIDFIRPSITNNSATNKRAVVLCHCHKDFIMDRGVFNKEHTCFMIHSTVGTGRDCKFACIGLGDCVKVCPQQAIKIVNNTAVISSLCIGCGKCLGECPINIIKLVPEDTGSYKICANDPLEFTSCSANQREEKLSWNDKKDFKIWTYCYKLIKRIVSK